MSREQDRGMEASLTSTSNFAVRCCPSTRFQHRCPLTHAAHSTTDHRALEVQTGILTFVDLAAEAESA